MLNLLITCAENPSYGMWTVGAPQSNFVQFLQSWLFTFQLLKCIISQQDIHSYIAAIVIVN